MWKACSLKILKWEAIAFNIYAKYSQIFGVKYLKYLLKYYYIDVMYFHLKRQFLFNC